ncbi:MAG: prenyltransferase/squalene oxidase repeat-containing protein [Planctomycetota bacterium]
MFRLLPRLIAGLAVIVLLCCVAIDAYAQQKPQSLTDHAQTSSATDVLFFDDVGNLLPKHFNEQTQKAIGRGMAYLASTQHPDGSWRGNTDGATFPVTIASLSGMAMLAGGNTTSRGPYASNVKKAVRFVLSQADPNTGIIARKGGQNEAGWIMYPHGFAMLFLSSAYGMESDEAVREKMRTVIEKGIKLISSSQSAQGGWWYTPDPRRDEGSITVTQLQALRAAHNAGFVVPEDTIKKAIHYLELCRTPEGGIRYAFNSGNTTRLPISAAALPCMYSTGDYESEMAEKCLGYVFKSFCLNGNNDRWNKGQGHSFYAHYYAAQAFYQAGDEYWDTYFPAARDQLLKMQGDEGQWKGPDGAWQEVGPVYRTALALTILQLPYKYLPIYQR